MTTPVHMSGPRVKICCFIRSSYSTMVFKNETSQLGMAVSGGSGRLIILGKDRGFFLIVAQRERYSFTWSVISFFRFRAYVRYSSAASQKSAAFRTAAEAIWGAIF